MGKTRRQNGRVSQVKWNLQKLSAPPNLEVRSVSCNESAIKRWSSELEETLDQNHKIRDRLKTKIR